MRSLFLDTLLPKNDHQYIVVSTDREQVKCWSKRCKMARAYIYKLEVFLWFCFNTLFRDTTSIFKGICLNLAHLCECCVVLCSQTLLAHSLCVGDEPIIASKIRYWLFFVAIHIVVGTFFTSTIFRKMLTLQAHPAAHTQYRGASLLRTLWDLKNSLLYRGFHCIFRVIFMCTAIYLDPYRSKQSVIERFSLL